MSLSMHRATIPVLVRGLTVLGTLLHKAEAHEDVAGLAPGALIQARLYEDMATLAGQVQRASDTAKATAERLSGVAAPSLPDTETSYPELIARVAATITYLQSIPSEAFEGSDERGVPLKAGPLSTTLSGADYLLQFGLPNVFFHITTAYDILRSQGVKIGKLDYIGPL